MNKKLIIGIAAVAVLVIGIGGVILATKSSTKAKPAAAATTSFASYRACLSAHGVTLPTRPAGSNNATGGNGSAGGGPGGGGPGGGGFRGGGGFGATPPAGVSQSDWDNARAACKSQMPTGGFGGGGAQANPAQFQAYLSCLKDHGVNVDPNGGVAAMQGVDRTSAAFQSASQTCAPLRPARGQGSTTPTTSALQ